MKILINNDEFNKAKSRELIPIECDVCKKPFFRKKNIIQAKLKKGTKFCRCSNNCYKKTGKIVKCYTCGKEIYKHLNTLIRFNKHYCSSKCSCIQSNKIRWKNHICTSKNKICDICNFTYNYKTKSCPQCNISLNKKLTIKQLKSKYKKTYSYWYSSEIRSFNRRWNKNLLELPCQKCGYNKHVELCHIIPINKFKDDTTLEEVNSKENNIVLCPTHHWEFDNNILNIEEIGSAGRDRTDI